MKTILVPTDFSDAATNAAEYAAHLSRSVKARVLLFHVYQVYATTAADFPVMPMALEEMQQENENYLKKEAAELRKRTGAEVDYEVRMGMALDEIRSYENIDLIVMGMKGAGKLTEALLGSTAASTFRSSKVPVLLVPAKAKYKKPETIVFACDYNPSTDIHTLDALTSFAKAFDPKLYVVNVKHKKEVVPIKKEMGTKLDGQLSHVEHVYYFSDKDDLVEGINEFATDHHADIIAVVPHKYTLMDGLFHKSVSKRLAFHTNVPLLALPENHRSVAAYFH